MWILLSLLSSFASMFYYFGNQVAKVPANVFMLYRGIVPIIFLLPFLPFVPQISSWQFYIMCFIQGFIISYIDYKAFRAIRTWGAETVSSIQPFSIAVVFIFWLLLKPYTILHYLESPLKFFLIILCLGGVIYSVSNYRDNKNSKKALYYLIPFLMMTAVCDTFNKITMSYVDEDKLIYGSYFYILISAFVVALVNIFILHKNKQTNFAEHFSWKNLRYSMVIFFLLALMLFKNLAMYFTPNPSYVTAILYVYIIWIMLANIALRKLGKVSKYKSISKSNSIVLLGSIIALIFLTR